ncbi:MAG TPA: hypothetical protein VK559_08420 [Ferruginibacter sp.]|nr:hypothetical protein [Ferruginibacter sp.]
MGESNRLFESLFKRDITASDNTEFLLQLTKEHPYFTAAQFFLLQQTGENTTGYYKQAAKTALLFNNPFWLSFQLDQAKERTTSSNSLSKDFSQHFTKEAEEDIYTEEESLPEIAPLHINLKLETASGNNSLEDELLFQPLFTRDYFASQGIKLSDDVLGSDKLGSQLKSFTSWLKTMKQIHIGQLLSETAGNNDSQIQNLAEKSNDKQEILTETMAEILIQQNRKDLAIGLYRKLSLLDPAKSTYFAAKIDHLKEQ